MKSVGACCGPRKLDKLLRSPAHVARLCPRTKTTQATGISPKGGLSSVLIANRGEIAIRVARTASEIGIRPTTVYTDPDRFSQHALSSPYSVNLGEPTAYLNGDRIIDIARREGCQSIHPGYGFLSENADFARKCVDAGLIFIGPPASAIEAMGSKRESKNIMTAAGVPCTPGYHGTSQGVDVLMEEAAKIGYPVLLKAVKGGGGKGMRIVQNPSDFDRQLESARSEAMNSFGDDVMLVEKYITTPRHIEVQIFADKHGNCVALGERDCSIQRRHQKILEESPAPNLPQHIRRDLWDKACAAALAVQYEGAGTVEFIFDNQTGEFFFMEMNTRLQVEHPVTEMVTGEDLVHWQFLIAAGERLPLSQSEIEERISSRGWGIEARIYAENPDMNFIPDSGRLVHLKTPKETETVRVDAGFCEGDEISSYYDPMIAKLIVGAPTRQEAIFKLRSALEEYEISGPITNIEFLKRICSTAGFKAGDVETGFIDKYHDELFPQEAVPSEVFVQAAIGLLMYEAEEVAGRGTKYRDNQVAGFDVGQQQRQLRFLTPDEGGGEKTTDVTVRYWEGHAFDASVTGKSFTNVTSHLDRSSKSISSFFPHTRLTSTIVFQGDSVDVFQRGKHYRLKCASPNWIQKALGVKDVTGSVLAPMPCKILRLEVSEGDEVKKDQPLVVLESMKMETTIRSPHDGVIAKIVHKQGELCKAGTALVEFEMPES